MLSKATSIKKGVVGQMLTCCSLLDTSWERADLLALLYVMFSCVFVTFICGVLDQVWYLSVWIPDIYLLPYFYLMQMHTKFDQHIPCGSINMSILTVWYQAEKPTHTLFLSYDVASGNEITPCNKICKPLVVYRFSGNVMTSMTTLRT